MAIGAIDTARSVTAMLSWSAISRQRRISPPLSLNGSAHGREELPDVVDQQVGGLRDGDVPAEG